MRCASGYLYVHTHTRARARARTHTHTRMYTHTHKQTHTYTQALNTHTHNTHTYWLANSILHCFTTAPAPLAQPIANAAQYGNSRIQPIMLERLACMLIQYMYSSVVFM